MKDWKEKFFYVSWKAAGVDAWRNLFPHRWVILKGDYPSDFVLNLEEKALMKMLVKEKMIVHLLKEEVFVKCDSSPTTDLDLFLRQRIVRRRMSLINVEEAQQMDVIRDQGNGEIELSQDSSHLKNRPLHVHDESPSKGGNESPLSTKTVNVEKGKKNLVLSSQLCERSIYWEREEQELESKILEPEWALEDAKKKLTKDSRMTKVEERSSKKGKEENNELKKKIANLKRQFNEAITQLVKSNILAIEAYKKSQLGEAKV